MGRGGNRAVSVLAVAMMLVAVVGVLPAGAGTVSAVQVAVRAAAVPGFTAFAPNYGPAGTRVTISGSGFSGVAAVLFNGAPAEVFTVSSPTSITATVPATATTGPITVRTAGGSATTQLSFSVSRPTVSLSVDDGVPGTPITVIGSGFRPFEQVELAFGASPGSRASADSRGAFRGRFFVPIGPRSGSTPITAAGLSSRLTAGADFQLHNDWPRLLDTGPAPIYDNRFEGFLGRGNAGSLQPKWKSTTVGAIAAVAGSLVYLTGKGSITAVRTSNGGTAWTRSAGFSTTPMIVDGVLYVGGSDGALHALNPVTGAEIWRTPVSTVALASMAIWRGTAYLATAAGTLVAVNLSTRLQRWSKDFGGPLTVAAITSSVVYLESQNRHRISAVRLSDRSVLWTHDIEARATLSGLVYAPEGPSPAQILFTTQSPQVDGLPNGVTGLWALDATTGAVRWLDDRSTQVGGAGWASAPTVDALGRAFFAVASNVDGNPANSVNAIAVSTGAVSWSVTSVRGVAGGLGRWADPVLANVANEVVYIGSCGPNHKFLALDAGTGAIVRDYFPSRCGQAIVTNSRVYLADLDGLSALGLPQERPATQLINDTVLGGDVNSLFYSAGWATATNPGEYRNDDHYSRTTDAFIRFSMFGTAFRYWFSMAPHHGIAEVTIDNQVVATIDQYAPVRMDGMTSWTSPGLQNGRHDVTIRVTGTRNPASSGTVVTLDRLDVTEDD